MKMRNVIRAYTATALDKSLERDVHSMSLSLLHYEPVSVDTVLCINIHPIQLFHIILVLQPGTEI